MNVDILVPSLLLSLPGFVTVVWQGRLLVAAFRSTRYAHTKGHVKRTATFSLRSPGPPERISALVYKYTVGGREYDGYRVGFGRFGGSRYGPDRYVQGDAVTVWYDPDRPERAVLETGPAFENYLLLVLGALLLGTGIFLFVQAFGAA